MLLLEIKTKFQIEMTEVKWNITNWNVIYIGLTENQVLML